MIHTIHQKRSSDSPQKVLSDYVSLKGLKSSKQRINVLETFFALNEHTTIENLLEKLRENGHKIGQATVYRSMKLLCECGLADAHRFGDGSVCYEPVKASYQHHDHLICNDCGHITEFINPQIEKLQEDVCKQLGFALYDHKMELYGNCIKKNCEFRNDT